LEKLTSFNFRVLKSKKNNNVSNMGDIEYTSFFKLYTSVQMIQPTRCNSFTSLLLDVYVWLNMFRASPRPSSGAYNYSMSLWFKRWRLAAGDLLVVVWQTCQTTTNNSPAANLQRLNQRLLLQLYAPDDRRGDARNMLSHT
jgi:hypothetical protein